MSNVARFWCHEAQNIRCVREADYDALLQENEALRGLYKMHRETETREMLGLRARVERLHEALEDLLGCPASVVQATVPKAGIEAAPPYQVVLDVSISLTRWRKAQAVRASDDPPQLSSIEEAPVHPAHMINCKACMGTGNAFYFLEEHGTCPCCDGKGRVKA